MSQFWSYRCRKLIKHKNKILKISIMKEQQTSATIVVFSSFRSLSIASLKTLFKSEEKSKPANGLSRISPPSSHRKCWTKTLSCESRRSRSTTTASGSSTSAISASLSSRRLSRERKRALTCVERGSMQPPSQRSARFAVETRWRKTCVVERPALFGLHPPKVCTI